VITRIVEGHPNSRLDELLLWAYTATPDQAPPTTHNLKEVA
jgi:hypothetical protein